MLLVPFVLSSASFLGAVLVLWGCLLPWIFGCRYAWGFGCEWVVVVCVWGGGGGVHPNLAPLRQKPKPIQQYALKLPTVAAFLANNLCLLGISKLMTAQINLAAMFYPVLVEPSHAQSHSQSFLVPQRSSDLSKIVILDRLWHPTGSVFSQSNPRIPLYTCLKNKQTVLETPNGP